MAFNPLDLSRPVVQDWHYHRIYNEGEPGFEISDSLDIDSLKSLNGYSGKILGLHYCIKHAHHISSPNHLDLQRCEDLLEKVEWDIRYFEMVIGKLPLLTHSQALKILTYNIQRDVTFRNKVQERIKELKQAK